MRFRAASVLVIACVAELAQTAAADIAYDSITSFTSPQTQTFQVVTMHADDVTLDAAAGLTLTRVDLLTRLRSMAAVPEFNGTLTVRVYAGGAFTPGAQLAEVVQPLVVPRGTDLLASVDFPAVALTDSSIFVGWFFTMPGRPTIFNDMWVRQNLAPPSVGSTTAFLYASNDTTPPFWSAITANGANYSVRVHTVPAPTAALTLAVALPAASRRRGRRQGKLCACHESPEPPSSKPPTPSRPSHRSTRSSRR